MRICLRRVVLQFPRRVIVLGDVRCVAEVSSLWKSRKFIVKQRGCKPTGAQAHTSSRDQALLHQFKLSFANFHSLTATHTLFGLVPLSLLEPEEGHLVPSLLCQPLRRLPPSASTKVMTCSGRRLFMGLRKQPGRTLLLALMGTSLLLLFINQAGVKAPFLPGPQPPSPRLPAPYPSRRMQDYQVGFDEVTGRRSSSNDQGGGAAMEGEMVAVNETEDLMVVASAERISALAIQEESTPTDTLEETVQEILKRQRGILLKDMDGYSFHPALKAKRVEDLMPESGGQPVRSLVVTTWRSGSTFIGDVLQSHPAIYYHYEPLLDFDIVQVRHGKAAKQALHNLRHLLTCDYSDMDHYLTYGQSHPWLFNHNKRLWAYCMAFPNICWSPRFLTPFCKLFPFQSLKTVRLRLNLTEEFLHDKELGVQVLLLVRDPRGTMQSRHHREWCPGNPDCDDPAWLCQDLVSDFHTAKKFLKKFPNSFRMIRYEDLSFHAYNVTRELFEFFHLSYHPQVEKFLDTHTKRKIGGVSSTFRDSKVAPIHWQQDLPWEEVKKIQSVCGEALRLWGYRIAKDEEHLRSFNPVGKFKII